MRRWFITAAVLASMFVTLPAVSIAVDESKSDDTQQSSDSNNGRYVVRQVDALKAGVFTMLDRLIG